MLRLKKGRSLRYRSDIDTGTIVHSKRGGVKKKMAKNGEKILSLGGVEDGLRAWGR